MENGLTLSTQLLHSLLHKEAELYLVKSLPSVECPPSSSSDKCRSEEDAVDRLVRDREASWICAMGRRLHLGLNTVGLAVAILDRVLALVLVRSK